VINVGSGQETSVNQLVQAIGDAVGKHLEPIYNPGQSGGVGRMRADISRARDLLGFAPRTSLPEGLALTARQDPRFTVSSG